ncbi:hypothetical protein TM239_45440 [Bradyrhizobium sp. TM239]|nr:hypothetical protein [Bradyrhizobium liaoningense]GMO37719.1 hypothetical protein TM233_54270 [Bradyrhizobium sp. TM233]GMP06480.1 hypothetical protein TM239_45440 [Bradyrhizobium sp. TM239]
MIVPVVKRYPQTMDGIDVRGYLVAIVPIRSPAKVQAGLWRTTAMTTSRRILLAGMAGLAVAPTAVAAAPAPVRDDATVAEERFARMIAAAHAPDVTCARQAERYADAHWPDYVVAARAVIDARA